MARATTIARRSPSEPVSTLPEGGRVLAVVVGLEDYQDRDSGALTKVDYARRDAEGFSESLATIYPNGQLQTTLLIDNNATLSNISDELTQTIASLDPDDLFVFYYAGHGFYDGRGNRITAWDTHTHNIEGTTLLLREVLIDPLEASACHRALAFVDACASEFETIIQKLGTRNIVSSLDPSELRTFLNSAQYCALFLSCTPGEQSYSITSLQHGIWTHFLLKALNGEVEDALGPERYLTDAGLRDYLSREVPNYITQNTTHRGRQTPQAMITASSTFAIREVPIPSLPIDDAGDLRSIRFAPRKEYLEGVESRRIRLLPGFSRSRGHFEPDNINDATTEFVRRLLEPEVDEEIQRLYDGIKRIFELRRRQIRRENGNGQGSLDTEFFRFSIDTRQDRSEPTHYEIVRSLELRGNPMERQTEIDQVFGRMFDKTVVEVDSNALNYYELVDLFENIEQRYGGNLSDNENREQITYDAPSGICIRIDAERGRIIMSGGGRKICSDRLVQARQYRFSLSGPSHLLPA